MEINEGNSINYLWFSLMFIIYFKSSHFYYSLGAKKPNCHWSGVQEFEDECILLALTLEIEKFILALQKSVIAKELQVM